MSDESPARGCAPNNSERPTPMTDDGEAEALRDIPIATDADANCYHDELMKIAVMVGEPDDPFAAWESIAALLARLDATTSETAKLRERVEELEEELAEKQAAIDAIYPAAKTALGLGQIAVADIAAEPPERRDLRLAVFRALDMPLACLGGHVTPSVRAPKALENSPATLADATNQKDRSNV